MNYEYDAFFSYKRHTLTNDWHETVRQKLAFYTGMELGLGRDASIWSRSRLRMVIPVRPILCDWGCHYGRFLIAS